jgi:hypothetical protein
MLILQHVNYKGQRILFYFGNEARAAMTIARFMGYTFANCSED